ncbi:MAG: InlB B-repeat-containing protein [Prevotella sp.]|nr:InlB B-repeat-containing protein [Prevotella sp.]
MKDFIRNFKIPLILGGCALIAVAVTLIVVTGGGGSSYGLYISSASGSVSVTNSDTVTSTASGDILKSGDIITLGADSSCVLAYKGKKNSEKNYIVLGSDSQAVVSGEFNGKENSELFLRSGSVICNFADEDHSSVIVRTADSMITTAESVSKISYSTNEFMSYTDLYTFMGDSSIQLYDPLGEPVNNAELQIEKKWGRVVSEDGPSFEALNLDFDLEELSASDLKNLITIAAIVGEDFPYSPEELKAAYDKKSDGTDSGELPPVEEQQPTETVTDSSDIVQTAEPIVTTTAPAPTETTLPGYTTAAPVVITTTAPVTTTAAAPAVEPAPAETSGSEAGTYHTVTVIVDGEETIQEIIHGGNAVKPEDPNIEGLEFIGWDGSFENITEDRVITAQFNEFASSPSSNMHTVTVVIGNRSNTIEVEHGKSANLPATVNVEGYIFKGWDKDFTNITEDIVISAILEKASTHTVTFIVGSESYPIQVEHGGAAVPPYIPNADSDGNRFVGWDKELNNIIMDTTITAVFATGDYHTVIFVIDGQFYTVKVADGETAEPPFWPITDSNGNRFLGWDKNLDNIKDDITITAYYG